MKKLLSLLLCFSPLLAQECCETCCGYSFAAEWLYFTPSFDQNAFIWDGRNDLQAVDGTATRLGEKQQYYSAYRVAGAYHFANCLNEISVWYTNFSHSYYDAGRVDPGSDIIGFSPTPTIANNDPINFTFDRDYHYYNIVGLFKLYSTSFCHFTPAFSGGIKFAHLHLKEQANLNSAGFLMTQSPDMCTWALGLCGALDGNYCLTECLDIKGRFLFGLLASQARSRLTTTQEFLGPTSGEIAIKNSPKYWHVVESLESRLGINYQKACAIPKTCLRFNLDIEGGFEQINELWFLDRIQGSFRGGWSFDEWSDFTLFGPYLRMNLTY
ncbi:MAG: hypothetical protein H7A36_02650 [Chlamydiales bacterium]|nr:hypothetical protein [Chlamydiales bacterium]